MINLIDCKTAGEALDKIAKESGYADYPAQIYVHNSETTAIDFKIGDFILKWRKPKKESIDK